MSSQASNAAPRAGETSVPVDLTRDALIDWGARFGATLRPPCVIVLRGDLGAGKTTLAQAICRGYGVTSAVTSPTFALLHEYQGAQSPVLHFDLYRLRDERELLQLGWDELIATPSLILIEWPERAGALLPATRIEIQLEHVAHAAAAEHEDVRRLTIR